jgi:hypothetical protein
LVTGLGLKNNATRSSAERDFLVLDPDFDDEYDGDVGDDVIFLGVEPGFELRLDAGECFTALRPFGILLSLIISSSLRERLIGVFLPYEGGFPLNHDAIEPSSGLGYSGKSIMVMFVNLNDGRIIYYNIITIIYYSKESLN